MRTTTVIIAALLLALPVAAANWNYRGNNEPDTSFDSPAFMWEDAHTGSGEKIYFNGFARIARETHYNPNVAALGSRIQPPVTAMAMVLGFWKDCNGDGYVGMPEQTLLEYKSELLAVGPASHCPATPPANGVSPHGFLYPHNDGTWVRELIWIGPRLGGIGAAGQNPTNFYADGTGVWGDWGAPGTPATLICPTSSNLGVRSTGALIDHFDCNTYYRGIVVLNTVGGPVGGWEPGDVDNSDSEANVDNPAYPFLYGPAEPEGHAQEGDYRGHSGGFFGRDTDEDDQRERLVTVVDCDANGGAVDGSPTVATGWLASPTDPASYPTAYESINDSFEVLTQGSSFAGSRQDPCAQNASSDEGLGVYPSVEGYVEPTNPLDGRREVDFAAEFSTGSRNVVPGATCTASFVGPNQRTTFVAHPVLGFCPPADGGTAVERDDFAIGPAWRTNAQINTHGITTRESLKNVPAGPADPGAFYYTFYARVGDMAFTKGSAPGSARVYGAEACGAFTSGVRNGWNCDPAVWEARCVDPELDTLPAQCYKVGETFHMRDVDCWDGTLVRGSGLKASLADAAPSGGCQGYVPNEQPDLTFR